MAKPVILTVDDDPNVLAAIARDLRRRYAEQYRILRADSGMAALEAVRELRQRGEHVALFLVDQRMPQMSGVEFLAEAVKLFPKARRALLTAYADTDAAIQAINAAAVHYYLLKPWNPPEEQLYPVLDDLLADWYDASGPIFEGLRIVGQRGGSRPRRWPRRGGHAARQVRRGGAATSGGPLHLYRRHPLHRLARQQRAPRQPGFCASR